MNNSPAEAQPDHLREFAERVRALIAPFGSLAKAAKALDIPENTLRRACAGTNEPQAPLLIALSTKLNVSMSYLLGLTDDPSVPATDGGPERLAFERVPSLDARVAAGIGAVNHHVAIEERLAFPDWMLRKLSPRGATLAFLRAKGDSMEPLFDDGALLLVDEGDVEPPRVRPKDGRPSDVFVFLQDDALRVKRLRRRGTELLVFPENRAYDPEILRGPDLKRCKILGRVIWWDNRL